jgi:hypothetical protein
MGVWASEKGGVYNGKIVVGRLEMHRSEANSEAAERGLPSTGQRKSPVVR